MKNHEKNFEFFKIIFYCDLDTMFYNIICQVVILFMHFNIIEINLLIELG
jgi:hypothetical protein